MPTKLPIDYKPQHQCICHYISEPYGSKKISTNAQYLNNTSPDFKKSFNLIKKSLEDLKKNELSHTWAQSIEKCSLSSSIFWQVIAKIARFIFPSIDTSIKVFQKARKNTQDNIKTLLAKCSVDHALYHIMGLFVGKDKDGRHFVTIRHSSYPEISKKISFTVFFQESLHKGFFYTTDRNTPLNIKALITNSLGIPVLIMPGLTIIPYCRRLISQARKIKKVSPPLLKKPKAKSTIAGSPIPDSFKSIKDVIASATVLLNKGKYHCYGTKLIGWKTNITDSGWGCLYRTLQSVVSFLKNVKTPTILEIQNKVKGAPNYGRIIKEKSNQWLEPYHVKYYLQKVLEIKSELILYNKHQSNFKTDKSLFDTEGNITLFKTLSTKLIKHFKDKKTPVVIDNGTYAYAILGIKKTKNHTYLLMSDPHAYSSPIEGIYTIQLDNSGKLKKHPNVETSKQLHFTKNDHWMICFPGSKKKLKCDKKINEIT